MAWTHGFHNSMNGDRVYNADQMSSIFEGLITDGVYEAVGNKLAVEPNSGMVIQIATGRGWFNKRWVSNDTPYLLTLENSDVLLNRYAAICVRSDNTDSVRATVPYVKYSDFATNPAKPTVTRTDTVKEYILAYVYIRARATAISAADIEDTRQNKILCGWVTGLIDQITPDTLYRQFTEQFNQWFNGLVDIIDSDVETTLVNAMARNATIAINVDKWEPTGIGTGYTADIILTNMTSTKSVFIWPTDVTEDVYEEAQVKLTRQVGNRLTFTANQLPSDTVAVNITYMGQ